MRPGELATKSRDEVLEGIHIDDEADVSPQPFEAETHDNVIRSLKESRRFERMSSTKFSTTSTAAGTSLCLPATETSSLQAFAALPLAIKLARYPSLN
jgi:hypothetical protein